MGYKKFVYTGDKPVLTEAVKAKICFDVMSGKINKNATASFYHVHPTTIDYWIKCYKKIGISANLDDMNEQQNSSQQSAQSPNQDPAVLQKNNEELQQALRLAELKIVALEALIDTAEAELSIDIRKKPGAKQ